MEKSYIRKENEKILKEINDKLIKSISQELNSINVDEDNLF